MNPGIDEALGLGVAGALLSGGLTALAIRYASGRGLLDRPGPRRSHALSTPRGGGVAIVASIVLLTQALAWWEPSARSLMTILGLGALSLAAVGFWDDHRPLPAGLRLGFQFLAGAIVIWRLGGAGSVEIAGWSLSGWPLDLLALLALVWLINLFNFMDGINGLASSQAVFTGVLFALFSALHGDSAGALLGVVVAGACLGFLPWNFPRARIFMGDAGSYGLGLVLGVLFLRGHQQSSFGVPVALSCFGVFVVDATLTLLWRLRRRARWYTAHREHAYQRLVRAGWSHARVVGAVSLVNLLLVSPLLWWAWGNPGRELGACALVLAVLAGIWAWIRRNYAGRLDTAPDNF